MAKIRITEIEIDNQVFNKAKVKLKELKNIYKPLSGKMVIEKCLEFIAEYEAD